MSCEHKNAKISPDLIGARIYCADCDEIVAQFQWVVIDGVKMLVDVNDVPLYDDDAQGWEP